LTDDEKNISKNIKNTENVQKKEILEKKYGLLFHTGRPTSLYFDPFLRYL